MEKWIPPALVLFIVLSVLEPLLWILWLSLVILILMLLWYFNKTLPPPYLSVTSEGGIAINWYSKSNQETFLRVSIPQNKDKNQNLDIFEFKIQNNEYTTPFLINNVIISPDSLPANQSRFSYQIMQKKKDGVKTLFGGKDLWFRFSYQMNEINPLKIVSFGDIQPKKTIPPLLQLAIMHRVKKENPDILLFLGDHTNEGTQPEGWVQLYHLFGKIASHTPVLGVPGNHDTKLKRKSGPRLIKDAYISHVNYPGEKTTYWAKYGPINIIGFDFMSGFKPDSINQTVLTHAIQNFPKKNWTFVLWHSSPYNTLKEDENMREIQQSILPQLDQFPNKLWLGGHEHSYQKFLVDDVYYLTSAATSSFHNHHSRDEHMEKYVKKFHVLSMDLNPKSLKINAITIFGKSIDEFEIQTN